MTHYFMRDEKNRKWVEVGTPKPADMVSVVRCRDCRFYEETGNCNWFECSCGMLAEVTPDGFCAWGERESE